MKLIDQFESYNYGATNYLYEFENGLKLIVTEKNDSQDFYAAVAFKGGSYAERQYGAKDGSVHFLEHLMIYSPGKIFKTAEEKKSFEDGDEVTPGINTNGMTSGSLMWVYADAHIDGKMKVLKMLESYLDPEADDLSTEIERQRSIILSERDRKPKKELDSHYQFMRFMFEDFYPELVKYNLGEPEDIRSMNIDDLMVVRNEFSKSSNAIMAVQTNRWPDPEVEAYLEKLSKYFTKANTNIEYEYRDFKDEFKVRYMKEPDMQNIFISINTLYERNKDEDDEDAVLEFFGKNFIWKIMNEYLREDKHLVYSTSGYVETYFVVYENKGFCTSVPFNKLKECLDGIDHVLTTYWKEFLYSDKGENWFRGLKSNYIFNRTSNYDLAFAVNKAANIIAGVYYKNNYNDRVEFARKLTREDFELYFREQYLSRPNKIWIKGSLDESEVMDVVRESKLFKRLSI